jgi:hypothetical protein
MRRPWGGLTLVFALVCALVGCATEDHLRPPKPPETHDLPPTNVASFSQPPNYPRKYLMEDAPRNPTDPAAPDSPIRRAGGGGSGMGASRGY